MRRVPPERFARSLRRMEPAARAAFVADLWAARGFETIRDGGAVTATREGTTVDIECRSSPPAEGRPDVVIDGQEPTGEEPDGPRRIGPTELRRMLLYALDREVARRLYEAHFDHAFDAGGSTEPHRQRLHSRRPGAVLVVLVVLVSVLGIVAVASGGSLLAGQAPTPVMAVPPVTAPPGAEQPSPGVALEEGAADRPAGGGDLFRYPPGLGPSGVTNVSALAEAHSRALAGESWQLRLTHNGSLDLMHPYEPLVEAEQAVVRTGTSRYRFEHTGRVQHRNGSAGVTAYVEYGDGTANYRRLIGLHGEAYRRTQLPPDGPPGVFTNLSTAYVERYLATTQSRVESVQIGNATRQRVVATGRPTALARTVSNYTAIATVDRRGVVHTLRVEYTLLERVPDPTPNGVATPYASPDDVPTEPVGQVRFTFVLTGMGETTLETPSWYVEAIGSTNSTGVPPWPTDPAV